MKTFRLLLAGSLLALPLSTLACGGGMSDSDMTYYAAQHHISLLPRVSARTLHLQVAQLEKERAKNKIDVSLAE